jgi:glucose-1-phosphate thymidylyltransferase
MIYYPLDVLLRAGIREVLIITPPDGEQLAFEKLLGDGNQLGISISYAVQPVARGIADALIIGESFLQGDDVCLVLGDNVFFSPDFRSKLEQARMNENGATIFGYKVEDPRAFGVVEFDEAGNVLSLEEKPQEPKSNYIVPGLYFYDSKAIGIAKTLGPSARGELEITDVNIAYMKQEDLKVVLLSDDFVWLDAGTAESLVDAAYTIRNIQNQTKKYVACIEQTAFEMDFISKEKMRAVGEQMASTAYGKYLLSL